MIRARPLSDTEFGQEAEPALRRVFASLHPCGSPINPAIEGRAILYPVATELTDDQLHALQQAALATTGDDSFFYVSTEGEATELRVRADDGTLPRIDPSIHNLARHWWIPFDETEQYRLSVDVGLESALVSPTGLWGLLISHMDFAVAAGQPDFIHRLVSNWPKDPTVEDQGPRGLAKYIGWIVTESGNDHALNWLTELLAHVYGAAEAERLLAIK